MRNGIDYFLLTMKKRTITVPICGAENLLGFSISIEEVDIFSYMSV